MCITIYQGCIHIPVLRDNILQQPDGRILMKIFVILRSKSVHRFVLLQCLRKTQGEVQSLLHLFQASFLEITALSVRQSCQKMQKMSHKTYIRKVQNFLHQELFIVGFSYHKVQKCSPYCLSIFSDTQTLIVVVFMQKPNFSGLSSVQQAFFTQSWL